MSTDRNNPPPKTAQTQDTVHQRVYEIDGLEEHVVADTFIKPLLEGLPENVVQILYYSATEMLNNAIDHSEGKGIKVAVSSNPDHVEICVFDDGVGIFNKIKTVFELDDPRDAILQLCKGKLTTDPQHHTGEGIFFTSRACDSFSIRSDTFKFLRFNKSDWLVEQQDEPRKGTAVYLQVGRRCERKLQDVFKAFTADDDEFGFTRTRVPIFLADYAPDGLVSRSKAKRVVHRFGKFREVILDFDRVESIGQSFADEIFRVFEKAHPEVHITVVNANENVERMIRRASNSNIDSDEPRV